MRMCVMRCAFAPRHLIAPDIIAKLRPHEDPGFGEREQVAVDRRAIEGLMRQPLGELTMADRRTKAVELTEDHHPLIREPQPLLDKQAPQPLVSRLDNLHLRSLYLKTQARSRARPVASGAAPAPHL